LYLWCLTKSGKAGKAGHYNCKINRSVGQRAALRRPDQSVEAGYAFGVLPALSTIWAGCWLLFSTPVNDMVSLTAVAAIAVLSVLAAGALRRAAGVGGDLYGLRTAEVVAPGRSHAVPRHADPDAAGRARPRAPTADPAA
jgi:hypothetical protein